MIPLLIIVFVIGYLAITLEHSININKSATALITAVLCWTLIISNAQNKELITEQLSQHLSSISGIVFFLLGAMTIVEIIDAHDGFYSITESIKTTNKTKLVWLISIITFFLSAVLDNLTSTIVMMSILNKLIQDKKTKWLLLGLVIISSNAGGAWSPIGDVTTTMLWIGGQISPLNIIKQTFLASLVSMVVPTLIINYMIKGKIELKMNVENNLHFNNNAFERKLIFYAGIGCLLFVPMFKTLTHLPPYMGMLFCLGVIWTITELIHHKKHNDEKGSLSVSHALRKIDTPSI
jgi:Na+/H+ antiporter NhaD/arsenite permease-like protein